MNQKDPNNCFEDVDLINKIKSCCDDLALKELELRHSGICHQMIRKYYHSFLSFGIDPEEVASDKLYIIYKSAINFNPDKKSKFSTWVGNQMRYHCLNCINKRKVNHVSMDNDLIKNIIEKNQPKKDEFISMSKERHDAVFMLLEKLKDKRILKIFKLRYLNTKKSSWSKIGENMNLSTQTVINLHNKTVKLLKNKLTTKNNADII